MSWIVIREKQRRIYFTTKPKRPLCFINSIIIAWRPSPLKDDLFVKEQHFRYSIVDTVLHLINGTTACHSRLLNAWLSKGLTDCQVITSSRVQEILQKIQLHPLPPLSLFFFQSSFSFGDIFLKFITTFDFLHL